MPQDPKAQEFQAAARLLVAQSRSLLSRLGYKRALNLEDSLTNLSEGNGQESSKN